MMLKKLYLIDQCPQLIAAWQDAFHGYTTVEIICDDYFAQPADAMVSPANSFGIMDGGLDRVIRYELGFAVENRIQHQIQQKFHGELPVGSALIIPTDHAQWPWLIAAPTMRIPEDISNTLNPYLAFRAILLAIKHHNQEQPAIRSLVCAGLGTGIGHVDPQKCAIHMKTAFDQLHHPLQRHSYQELHSTHRRLHFK